MKPQTWLFLLVASISILSMSGVLRSADNLLTARITESIVDRGSLAVRPVRGFENYAVKKGKNGKLYPFWSFGYPVLALPLYAVSKAMPSQIQAEISAALPAFHILFYNTRTREGAAGFFMLFAGPLTLGFIAFFAYLAAFFITGSYKRAVFAALAATILSPLFILAQDFWQEVPLGLFLLVSYLMLIRYERKPKASTAFFAGISSGFGVLVKIAGLVGAGIFGLALFILFLKDRKKRGWLWFLLGFLPLAGVLLASNYTRFGNAFEFGYGHYQSAFTNPFWEGFSGLLISPGRGIFLFWPLVGAALYAGIRNFNGMQRLGIYLFIAYLLFYSKWFMWDGGWCFGPRFLAPLIPVLAVQAAGLRGRHTVAVLSVLAVLSAFVVITGLQADYLDYHYVLYRVFGNDQTYNIRWNILWSPLVGYWRLPVGNGWILSGVLRTTGWFLKFLFGGVFVVAVIAVVRLILYLGRTGDNRF